MSMIKLIMSDAADKTTDTGMSVVEDPATITKQASTIFGCDYSDLKPDAEHVGIHVVALGAAERYGANRNSDAWTKEACQRYHDTFVKHGHVYRHHRNRDPLKAIGTIKASAYNDEMDRVELFIHADKDKARDELNRLDKEGEIPFSMACFRKGTLIVTADGYKTIEDIKHGDIVLTHRGNWGEVKHLSRRNAETYMQVQLRSWGRTVIELTPNHEVYAASFYDIPKQSHPHSLARLSKTFKQAHRHELHTYAKWVRADMLTANHYLLLPIDRRVELTVTDSWARVLGYYIAEGSFSAGTTNYSCGVSDVAIQELTKLEYWTSATTTPDVRGSKCVNVACFGTETSNDIKVLCGRRGENKRIPQLIQHANAEAKFNFMAAWFNGDGWQDKNGLHWSTHYQGLGIELQRLLASVNIPSSCGRIDHLDDRGIVISRNAVEYVVTISNQYSGLFSGVSKALELGICGDTKCRTFISGDYLCVPVKHVKQQYSPVEVYNFGVYGDESYTAYGLAVHNCKVAYDRCSICGKHRKNSKDPNQCEHIAEKFGELLEDGRQVFTFNDEPQFFDISFVGRPADRIAWNLKVASAGERIDSIKLAEQSGLWVPDSLAIESSTALRKLEHMRKLATFEELYRKFAAGGPVTSRDRYIWELRKAAASHIDDVTIKGLRICEPSDVFSTFARNGIVMDPTTFYKYAFGLDLGEVRDLVPEAIQLARTVFSKLASMGECQTVCNDVTFDVDSSRRHVEVPVNLVKRACMDAGFIGDMRDERVVDCTIDNRQVKIAVDNPPEKDSNSNHKAMVLATKYAAYKLSAIEAIIEHHRDTDIDTVLAGLAAQNLVSIEE